MNIIKNSIVLSIIVALLYSVFVPVALMDNAHAPNDPMFLVLKDQIQVNCNQVFRTPSVKKTIAIQKIIPTHGDVALMLSPIVWIIKQAVCLLAIILFLRLLMLMPVKYLSNYLHQNSKPRTAGIPSS
ncbi:hypothetical protein [Paenibacillus taiwanensis]|uniref:hypothetical protein n=1 Tax=Paenibacillus taiwanensis TaxID=401638 RepID=UPI000412326C|nr:hypothetical protein [Paenibacillus taiwanensis]